MERCHFRQDVHDTRAGFPTRIDPGWRGGAPPSLGDFFRGPRPRALGLAEEAPDDVQDVHLRERLVVRIGTHVIVVSPEPECLDGRQAERLGSADVGVAPVPDEERARRVDAEVVKRGLKDRRMGLPLPHLGGEDGNIEAVGEPHFLQVAAQEPARVEDVRDEPEPEVARSKRVEKRVGGRAQLTRGGPGPVLGGEEARELLVGELDSEVRKRLAHHPWVLDLLERARNPEERHILIAKPRRRLSVGGKPVPVDRRKPGLPAGFEQGFVPREMKERVAPVEEDGFED